jgi:hypothetical protein
MKKRKNEIKYQLPYNYENSDINMRYTNENKRESNYTLTKKDINKKINYKIFILIKESLASIGFKSNANS